MCCVYCYKGATGTGRHGPRTTNVVTTPPPPIVVTTTNTAQKPAAYSAKSDLQQEPPPAYSNAGANPVAPQEPGAYPPQQPGAYPPQQPRSYPPQQPGAYPPGAYPPATFQNHFMLWAGLNRDADVGHCAVVFVLN